MESGSGSTSVTKPVGEDWLEVAGEGPLEVTVRRPEKSGTWTVSSEDDLEAAFQVWRQFFGDKVADEIRDAVELDMELVGSD